MDRARTKNSVALALLTLILSACEPSPELAAADKIYFGGPIVTVDDAQPSAEAVAVREGQILAVGTLADIEAHKSADIINELKPDKVTVDSPSTNCGAFSQYLMDLLNNKKTDLQCIHKADLLHVYVGAASILAKVTRDKEMDKICEKYGNCGPGYPLPTAISQPRLSVCTLFLIVPFPYPLFLIY